MFWVYFFMSSIFLQVMLLNLLIAIMGDTYDRVIEVRKESQLKEICAFISEYFFLFPKDMFTKNALILTAAMEGAEIGTVFTWEGKLVALKTHFTLHLANLEQRLGKMSEYLTVENDKGQRCVQD